MAITVAEALQAGRDKLGVKSTDPEFGVSKLLDALNATIGEFHQDLTGIRPEVLLTSATLAADGAESHVYTLASQTPAIGAVDRIRAVRLEHDRGALLDERPRSQLDDYGGPAYAVLGLPGEQTIETSRDIPAGGTLFMRYIVGPPTLTAGDAIPAWIPDRFKTLLGYKIASQCFSQGGEQTMPSDQARLMQMMSDQLWDFWAFLTPTALMRNDQGEGLAPFLF